MDPDNQTPDTSVQYSAGPVQYHVHDGTDAPLISPNNLIAGSNIVIGSSSPIRISSTGGGVTQLIAGSNIVLSPSGGTGVVTISASLGSGLGIARNIGYPVQKFLTGGTTTTLSIQTPTPGNTVMVVGAWGQNVTTDLLSSMTWQGTPLTRLSSVVSYGSQSLWYYYLLNPSQEAPGSLVVTTTSDPGSGGGSGLYIAEALYTGVTTLGFPQTSATNQGTSVTTLSTSVTTTGGYEWLIGVSGGNKTISTPNSPTFSNGTQVLIVDSNGSVNPPGTYSSTVNGTPSGVLVTILAGVEHG